MRLATFFMTAALLLLPHSVSANIFNAESFMLDNGMRVVVIPNHRAPVVTHMVWYQFGGADETPGKSGIAHLFEHLMFKGTPKTPDGAFSQTVKKLGGNDNAFTSHDYTAYYQSISKDHLATVMEMEADRMNNLTLKKEEVLSERQVVIEERHQRTDNNPQALFREQLMATLFINHPYATPVIGWEHEIAKLTRNDAFSYYKKWYAPNNAILVVAGDVTMKELKPLAQKYYGALKPSKDISKRLRPTPAPLTVAHSITLTDPRIGEPALMKTWRVARGNDALDIFTEIFGGTSTARLYKNLVIDQKIAISAGASYDPVSLNETSLTIYATPTPDTTLEQLEKALDKEITAILASGVTQQELDDAKNRKTASFTWYLDSLQGPAMLFGRALSSGFDTDYLEKWPERISTLTRKNILNAAKKVFNGKNHPITGFLLPQKKEENKK